MSWKTVVCVCVLTGRNHTFWKQWRRHQHLWVFVASFANMDLEHVSWHLEYLSLYVDGTDVILFHIVFRKTQTDIHNQWLQKTGWAKQCFADKTALCCIHTLPVYNTHAQCGWMAMRYVFSGHFSRGWDYINIYLEFYLCLSDPPLSSFRSQPTLGVNVWLFSHNTLHKQLSIVVKTMLITAVTPTPNWKWIKWANIQSFQFSPMTMS